MSVKELFKNNFVDSEEQIEPSETKIHGFVPEWLRGDLLRACQAKFNLDDDFAVNHYMDGLAMVYKFSFKQGKVTFSKRFLRTDAYEKSTTVGRPLYTEFGTKAYPDPNKGFLARMLTSFDPTSVTDNTGIHIFRMGGEVFAASDTCYFTRFDKNSLATKDKIDLHKMFGINFACCHVEEDRNGAYYLLGTSIMGAPKYHICEIKPTNKQTGSDVWNNSRIVASIPSRWKTSCSYNHSFAMTENYMIIVEQPYVATLFNLATAQIKGRSFSDCLDWSPEEGNRVIIVKRSNWEVISHYFLAEPLFYIHYTNAFEVDDHVIFDILGARDSSSLTNLTLDKLRKGDTSVSPHYIKRFVIPVVERIQNVHQGEELIRLKNCTASAKRMSCYKKGDHISLSGRTVSSVSLDNFSINRAFKGKPYEYVYANAGFLGMEILRNSIQKINVENGEILQWKESDYQYPSEPTFIPRPNSAEEDDGVVLFSLLDTRPDFPHYLIILDAKSFVEISRIETLIPIPSGHHGVFLPE